jgi:hypothetical protein
VTGNGEDGVGRVALGAKQELRLRRQSLFRWLTMGLMALRRCSRRMVGVMPRGVGSVLSAGNLRPTAIVASSA